MSLSPHPLPLAEAAALARRILAELAPVCEPGFCVVAGSVRRGCPLAGDIEIVAIPQFAASLFPGVRGASLLDVQLVSLMHQGRLMRAWRSDRPIEELTCKDFYAGALFREGHPFKVQVNVSDRGRWPVELAIKTGSAAFSKKLVTWRTHGGFLPGHWKIRNGWEVWENTGTEKRRLVFESERHFIEAVCGAWVPPELRD